MALTDQTTTLGRIGAGTTMKAHNPAGPVPVDDYLQVIVFAGSTSVQLINGADYCDGLLTASCILGVNRTPYVIGPNSGLLDGDPLDVEFTWHHADGTAVDGLFVTGYYSWDPTSTLWVLSAGIESTVLADIRRAVYRTFS